MRDGTVEIKSIARGGGEQNQDGRSVRNDADVDAGGSLCRCERMPVSTRWSASCGGEKIDIIEWNENPAILIEHALSPAKVDLGYGGRG